MFNSISGKNITFERVVKKVVKEVFVPIRENFTKGEETQREMNSIAYGRMVTKEIEEVTMVPMENGHVYEGSLFVKGNEDNSGGHYSTLTAAVNDLNSLGSSGPVTFILTDATYPSETFPITVNSWAGASAVNNLTIKPSSGVNATISGSSAVAIFKLNAADYVTIDGSNNGSSSRNLTIANTNTGTSGAIIWLNSTITPDGATNNTIKNCIITGNAPLTTFVGIVSSGSAVGTVAEAANSNNTYTNNVVSNSYYGIATVGPTGNESGTVITNNTVGTLGLIGIAIYQQQNASVSGNSITGITNASSGSAFTTSRILVSGTQDGSNISKNQIRNIKQTNTVGWGCNGIWLNASTTASNVTVSNNFISDVAAYGYLSLAGYSDNGYGIIAVTGGGYNIYYNTVSMNTSQTVDGLPAAFNVASTITTAASVNVRDNIFSNSQTVGTNRYSVYSGAANTVYADINYNDYYYGTAPNLGYLGAAQSGITQWRTATGKDVNSNSVIANFVNDATGDLHLTGASIGDINLLGTPIAGITTDIDGNARATEKPYMGADEATGLSGLTLKFNWEACPNPKTVTVQIRSSSSPYAIIEAVNGTGGGNVASTFNFGNAADATPYYVVVKSANSVETWSATPVTFTSHAANFDFTFALNQAYGSNQILSGGVPSIYQGDANQDGQVDGTDVVLTYNDASNFLTSPATDFNCDGTTDLTDILLAFGNAKNFVGIQRP